MGFWQPFAWFNVVDALITTSGVMTAPLLLVLAADALVVVLIIRNFRCRTADPPISNQILEVVEPPYGRG